MTTFSVSDAGVQIIQTLFIELFDRDTQIQKQDGIPYITVRNRGNLNGFEIWPNLNKWDMFETIDGGNDAMYRGTFTSIQEVVVAVELALPRASIVEEVESWMADLVEQVELATERK